MTITHEIERDEVMAYLDGELAAVRALAVRTHLEQCVECRGLADELRKLSADLAEWEVETAPATIALTEDPAVTPFRHTARSAFFGGRINWRWPGVAAAASVAVVLLTWTSVSSRRPTPAASAVVDKASPAPDDFHIVLPSAALDERRSDAVRSLGYASGRSNGLVGNDPGTRAFGQTGTIGGAAGSAPSQTAQASTEMIARTASVSVSTEKFDDMRAALEQVASAHHGSISALTVAGDPPNRRTLRATLRVPAAEMDAALAGVRGLGRVLQESQSSENITDAHRDLAIRISNAKVEEARLGEILKDRTGRLSDVLAVEQAQSRVRTEIEQMEAEELAMRNRAALSTINVEVDERYRAELADNSPLPVSTRLRNAVVDGARTAIESFVGVALTLLGAAPTLILWAMLLFVPVRALWRRFARARMAG